MAYPSAPSAAEELYVRRCVNTEYKMKIQSVGECSEALIYLFKVYPTRAEEMKSWHGALWHLKL